MIGEPPFDAGAVQLTVACWYAATAPGFVGVPGTPAGNAAVAWFESAEAGPVPAAFVAATVNL